MEEEKETGEQGKEEEWYEGVWATRILLKEILRPEVVSYINVLSHIPPEDFVRLLEGSTYPVNSEQAEKIQEAAKRGLHRLLSASAGEDMSTPETVEEMAVLCALGVMIQIGMAWGRTHVVSTYSETGRVN